MMPRSAFQILVPLVLVVLLGGTVVSAVDHERSRKTLGGLPGVNVLVERVEPPLDRSTIQTDVELRLRRAGIRVLSDEEIISTIRTSGGPILYVSVIHVAPDGLIGDIPVACRVDVQLKQIAVLARDPKVLSFDAITWSTNGFVGMAQKSRLIDAVRKVVRDNVDVFVNAYLSANPSVKPGTQSDDDEDTPKPQRKPNKKKAPKPVVSEEE